MTDLPTPESSVPARLGVEARFEDGELVLELTPQDAILHHGMVRASVLAYVVDAAAGICVDGDQTVWTLTTDLSVRARAMAPPASVTSSTRVLRRGGRSASCLVELTADDGSAVATGVAGFAHKPRRADDPPKPQVTPDRASQILTGRVGLERPLRDEAGIVVVDAAAGVVEVAVTPELRNPAGTLQGAMVALVAVAAAEELVAARCGGPVLVVDLDVRYLAQAPVGPVRSRARSLGEAPDAPVLVELVDTSVDRLTTVVLARAVPMPRA
jgi:acyl-coenzyme A thioesterase PaaI-like protein